MKTWVIVLIGLIILWWMIRRPIRAATVAAHRVGSAATQVGTSVAGIAAIAGLGSTIAGWFGTTERTPESVTGSQTSEAGLGDLPPYNNDSDDVQELH